MKEVRSQKATYHMSSLYEIPGADESIGRGAKDVSGCQRVGAVENGEQLLNGFLLG